MRPFFKETLRNPEIRTRPEVPVPNELLYPLISLRGYNEFMSRDQNSSDSMPRLILKDLARRILRDELTQSAHDHDKSCRDLSQCNSDFCELRQQLAAGETKITRAEGQVKPTEVQGLRIVALIFTLLPLLFFSGLLDTPAVISGALRHDRLLASKEFIVVGAFAVIAFIAIMVNLTAPIRHQMSGANKQTFHAVNNYVTRTEFALALSTGVVYALGVWGVENFWNVLGLSLSLTLILLPPLLRKNLI